MMRSVTLLAPAKINLFLQILGQRQDGFHDIYSAMQTVSLYDSITVSRTSTGITLACDDSGIPADSTNLTWRAAQLMFDKTGITGGVDINLIKRIPVGAGLGGGSSDAAAVMKAVNSLFDLDLSPLQMAVWSAELGSDIPFFFSPGSAVVTGRGEIVAPEDLFMGYFVLLIIPDFAVATKDAYQGLRFFLTNFSTKGDINTKLLGADFFKTLYQIGNDFQALVVSRHPEVESCMEVLRRGGAGYVALSGSGSAFYGLFERQPGSELMTTVSSQFGWQVYSLSPVRLTHN